MDNTFLPYNIDVSSLIVALSRVTFSVSQVASIRMIDKRKVSKLLGNEIRVEKIGKGRNGRIACNAYDTLKPLIEQAIILAYAKKN